MFIIGLRIRGQNRERTDPACQINLLASIASRCPLGYPPWRSEKKYFISNTEAAGVFQLRIIVIVGSKYEGRFNNGSNFIFF